MSRGVEMRRGRRTEQLGEGMRGLNRGLMIILGSNKNSSNNPDRGVPGSTFHNSISPIKNCGSGKKEEKEYTLLSSNSNVNFPG
jgi:hypothetical protein